MDYSERTQSPGRDGLLGSNPELHDEGQPEHFDRGNDQGSGSNWYLILPVIYPFVYPKGIRALRS